MPTVRELIDRAVAAHAALAEVASPVDEEWQYVADLGAVWRARLEHVSAARGEEPAAPEIAAAVDAAVEEVGLVADPHRAIDWLSTFPQVVLLALDEPA